MLYKDKQRFMALIMLLMDLAVVTVSFASAINVRRLLESPFLEPFANQYADYWDKLLLILLIWWVLLSLNSMYVSHRGHSLKQIYWIIVKVNVLGLLSIGAVLFFFQDYFVHRTLIFLFITICTVLMVFEKTIIHVVLHFLRNRDRFIKQALIVGTDDDAKWLLNRLLMQLNVGIRVIGFVSNNDKKVPKTIDGIPVLGSTNDIAEILEKRVIDEVFITSSLEDLPAMEPILLHCQDIGVNARLLLRGLVPHKASMFLDEFLNTPVVSFSTTPLDVFAMACKTCIDALASSVLLVVLSPLLLFIGLSVKLNSAGPALFRQDRVGKNGRVFKMYKFRSMIEDAEDKRKDVENLNTMGGPVFKARNDPRITRVGNFLRRTSLDELPQLLNVLAGEMSLVGPRPLPVYESDQISGGARRRLSMKPGITGLWQVSGRNELDFEEWIRLDLEYIDQWSLFLDTHILLRTVPVLLTRKGAF